MDNTLTNRWLDPQAYGESWGERSQLLLEMFSDRQGIEKNWSFSEYGCGNFSPFFIAATKNPNYTVTRYDIKQWDEGVLICDLNKPQFEVAKTDVCVLSGVCEYLSDVEGTLQRLRQFHDHFLLSYAVFPSSDGFASWRRNTNQWTVEMIHERAVSSGWRNHYTLHEFEKITASIGHISDIRMWKDQVLFYVRSR